MKIKDHFDLIVLGGGSGGLRMARLSAQAGKKVALIESRELGGTCVNRGCIPKKMMFYAADYGQAQKFGSFYGWQSQDQILVWKTLVEGIDSELRRLNKIFEATQTKNGVHCFQGRGRLDSPNHVNIEGEIYQADCIVIATGATPKMASFEGAEAALTSDDFFKMPTLPKRLGFVGSGYIGLELASLCAQLGSQATVFYHRDDPFHRYDSPMAILWRHQLEDSGVVFQTQASPRSLELTETGFSFHFDQAGKSAEMELDALFLTQGRVPNTQDLGLEALGLVMSSEGALGVDNNYQTNIPGVYAIGDCAQTDQPQLTPIAILQAERLHAHWRDGTPAKPLPSEVVSAVFTHPIMAMVGISEKQAQALGLEIKVIHRQFVPLKARMFPAKIRHEIALRMIVDSANEKVLGVQMLGEAADEIIQSLAVAITAGLTVSDFNRTMALHPTSSEEWMTMS